MIFYKYLNEISVININISKLDVFNLDILNSNNVSSIKDSDDGNIISALIDTDSKSAHILSLKPIHIIDYKEYINSANPHIYDSLFHNGAMRLNVHENISNFKDLKRVFRWLNENNYYTKNGNTHKVCFNINMKKVGWDFTYYGKSLKDISNYFSEINKTIRYNSTELSSIIDVVYPLFNSRLSEHDFRTHILAIGRQHTLDSLIIN